ncbi:MULTISPECIES: glycosyltransferase family 2 protein [unclassified Methylobacterium]|uniref:glycosyltransferase family 2 protein n=1 Tax=unclassified Methylobacterium TaxID=2615210 RepID=UPI00226A96A7|nr:MULTISPECIES: glycosyltransferase family 2 protein [unclassified Methylobacterium]
MTTRCRHALVELGRRADRRTGSIDAYLVVRDEAARLPYMFEHHRGLGVERFFVVDNASADGTAEFLAGQSDCYAYRTTASFAEANHGMDWINALVERHGDSNWCLFADADELLTYPHADRMPLRDLCAFLDRSGYEGLFATLLDMYPDGPVARADYVSGTPFLDTCRHHDTGYRLRSKVRINPTRPAFAEVEAVGGPRLRVFYPELARAGRWRMALLRTLRGIRLHPVGKKLGLGRLGSPLPPDLTKIPLVKGAPGRRWISNHRTTPLRLSPVTGALLHFKFFSDFHRRAVAEAARGEHWDGGSEYLRYAEQLSRDPNATLMHAGSEAFRSPGRLVDLGIMASGPELDRLFPGARAPVRNPVPAPAMRVARAHRF